MSRTHQISVVIPVYRAAATLPALFEEIARLHDEFVTEGGHRARVAELLLVHDNGPDNSDEVMRKLAAEHDWVRPVWLSRNFGQHPATMAGMASSGGDWIVTMDEDGQHDPAYIPAMLDSAMAARATVVYADPTNKPPHGFLRNTASRGSKRVVDFLTKGNHAGLYHSYRLVLGEVGRSIAAYAGAGVYLDVALGWVADDVTTCPILLREEGDRPSGYKTRTLLSHFWRMVLTSGTGLLRFVSLLGVTMASIGFLYAIVIAVSRLVGGVDVAGWTTVMVVMLIGIGAVLFSLGVVAEYIGVAVNMAMGKPLFLVTADKSTGPLSYPPEPRP
ncbi:MAG TPA: glycosyltransferase [Nocardioidaceae bacterium]|nr:glycosyltransferase [Nocardioidaceae bacterium]